MTATTTATAAKRLVKRGAEGDVFSLDWNGRPSVLKTRRPKAYRHPVLDGSIRRQRTVRESEIISLVKSFGVPAPLVYFVDTVRCEIVMQRIPGTPVHDLPPSGISGCCGQIGRIAGLLHRNGVMHGDLTTSNFIRSGGGALHIIDFGLALRTARPGDHAVDLRLIKEILNSAHAGIMEASWRNFLKGYGSVVGAAYSSRVQGLVATIEGRGRYARVV